MNRTHLTPSVLLIVMVLTTSGFGAALAPNDGSIAGNLSLWLRMPDINYDPDTGVWADLSGKGNDARAEVANHVGPTLSSGENATVFSHAFAAVHFDPTVQDLLMATNLNGGAGLTDLTIFSIQKVVDPGNTDQRGLGFGSYNDGGRADHFNMSFDVTVRKDNGRIDGRNQEHPLDAFVIYAARMNPAVINMWFNSTGTLDLAYSATGSSYTTSNDQFYVGDMRYPRVGDFDIAEVVVYNTALSDAQIAGISEWLQAFVGVPASSGASGNAPGNEATDVPRDAELTWNPVASAVTRDVYFGTVFEDVNDAGKTNPLGVLVGPAQVATSYDPGRLAFGQTYYWRVDEVNGAPDNTLFRGDIWSFTTEPLSIPIINIAATASSSFGASVAENTINGSGLVDDLHGTSAIDMWISTGIPATIEYAFDRAYKLHEMWVWNSNQTIEPFIGFGAKDVVIEHSLDGENWSVLEGVGPLAQASGMADYAHNTTIEFGAAVARYVRMTVNSVQGFAPQASLSEVRFFSIPTFATRPTPDSGATHV
ncbi:MAG: discoidin domain-containing protein, partial [Planctomycetes bacterium]|nr:discoidin domain-containing protein [Planctomycetota bacterium]